MSDLAVAAGLGLALGVVTGLPLGVVNVAVVATAASAGRGRALRVGLGGAVADGVHAAAAFTGLAALVTDHRRAAAVVSVTAGLALLIAGVAVARRPPAAAPIAGARPFWFGLALTLPNPAALSAWLAVAGALALPSVTAGAIAAAGVTVGSAAYFAALATMAARARPTRMSTRTATMIGAGTLAVVGAAVIARGLWQLVG